MRLKLTGCFSLFAFLFSIYLTPARADFRCAIAVGKESPIFLEGREGYLKALTQLANRHKRNFIQKNGAKKFLLELAMSLPADVREEAVSAIIELDIRSFDGDNADVNATAAYRLINAFRTICNAWNQSQIAKERGQEIDLEGLYLFDAAVEALTFMEIETHLDNNDARPEVELFQDRTYGGLAELQYWANFNKIAFAKNAREVMRRLLAGLPLDTPERDRERIYREVAAIKTDDGGNAFRQPDAAQRILVPWHSIAAAYALSDLSPPTLKGTRRLLIAMKAEVLLVSELQWFSRPDGGLPYLRDAVKAMGGEFGRGYTVRDFLIQLCRTQLPEPIQGQAILAIEKGIDWKQHDGDTAFRRGGGNAIERIFEGFRVFAEAWNQAHSGDTTEWIEVARLHTASELYRMFSLLGFHAPVPAEPSTVPPQRVVLVSDAVEETAAETDRTASMVEESTTTAAAGVDDEQNSHDPVERETGPWPLEEGEDENSETETSPSPQLTSLQSAFTELSTTPLHSWKVGSLLNRIGAEFENDAPSDVVDALWNYFETMPLRDRRPTYVTGAQIKTVEQAFKVARLRSGPFPGIVITLLRNEQQLIRVAAIEAIERHRMRHWDVMRELEVMAASDANLKVRARAALQVLNTPPRARAKN